MKFYTGTKGCTDARIYENGEMRVLDPRRDLCDHSPDGFAWGYGGSGPAQLALAICADALRDDQRALRVYQAFKWNVVSFWKQDRGWEIDETEVRKIVVHIEHLAASARKKGGAA